MYKSILDIIVCPKCHGKLELKPKEQINGEVIEGSLACINNHKWKIEEGVINFESSEQEKANNWSEAYKEIDYDELDIKIKVKTSQIELDAQEKLKTKLLI